LKREANRIKLKNLKRVNARYDAADPTRLERNNRRRLYGREAATPGLNTIDRIRERARDLEQNTATVPSLLNHISVGLIGEGIVPEPVLVTASGDLLLEVSDQLRELWHEWEEGGETSGSYTELEAQNLTVRSFYRDGEVMLIHHISRPMANSRIPYSYQLLESDTFATDSDHPNGIKYNRFGKPTQYRFNTSRGVLNPNSYTNVPAHKVSHLMNRIRIGQRRGISALAPIIDEIHDVDEIDSSERIAAKVASMMALVIHKGSTEQEYQDAIEDDLERDIEFVPGSIIDNLEVGERAEIVESRRPSIERMEFRKSILRGIAGGIGPVSFSNLAREYGGTYSSQRQELVEMKGIQQQHWRRYVQKIEVPKWKFFVQACQLAGLVNIPSTATERSIYYPDYTAAVIPWIDPAKEALAYKTMIEQQLESREWIARSRGRDIREIMKQQEAEKSFYNTQEAPSTNSNLNSNE